jgi:hypothetical protein
LVRGGIAKSSALFLAWAGGFGARRFLRLDHVTPWAVQGQSSVENLRFRCRAHNLHAARLYFGAWFMRKKQGRTPVTEGAAALSSASRGSVPRKASSACALRKSAFGQRRLRADGV